MSRRLVYSHAGVGALAVPPWCSFAFISYTVARGEPPLPRRGRSNERRGGTAFPLCQIIEIHVGWYGSSVIALSSVRNELVNDTGTSMRHEGYSPEFIFP